MLQALKVPTDDAPHLLVVDDDRRIRDLLSRYLIGEGYRVTTAESAAQARSKLDGLSFDLLILDVMMPGETGFELAQSIRTSSTVPILMLTARSETDNRIKGLELGADDYVPKPFEPRELSLRIANILKRAKPAPASTPETVRFESFVFHLARGELQQGETVVHLTDREREMLRVSVGDAGRNRAAAGAGGKRRRQQRACRRRSDQPAAAQDRARSGKSPHRANGARDRLSADDGGMTSLDLGLSTLAHRGRPHARQLEPASRSGSTARCRRASTPVRC